MYRLTVILSAEAADDLTSLARQKETTISRTVRESLATYIYLQGKVKNGAEIFVNNPGQTLKQVVLK